MLKSLIVGNDIHDVSEFLTSQGVTVTQVTSKIEFLELFPHYQPDILVVDLDGDLVEHITTFIQNDSSWSEVYIVYCTAKLCCRIRWDFFLLGGKDILPGKMEKLILHQRLQTMLAGVEQRKNLQMFNSLLKEENSNKEARIARLKNITIHALIYLCSARDQETGNHIVRTRAFTKLIRERLGIVTSAIEDYAPLHDIGKVGIPDSVLQKPGKLTSAEYEVVKTHTILGHKALLEAMRLSGETSPELQVAANIVRFHHERWDGKGYPDGLIGEKIPIEARIVAVSDVYDALRSERPYKKGLEHETVKEYILLGSGTQFCPTCVQAFLSVSDDFRDIYDKISD